MYCLRARALESDLQSNEPPVKADLMIFKSPRPVLVAGSQASSDPRRSRGWDESGRVELGHRVLKAQKGLGGGGTETLPQYRRVWDGEKRLSEGRIALWNLCTKVIFLASFKKYGVLCLPHI